MFSGIGLIAFGCIFGTGVIGLLIASKLPDHCRTDATRETVKTTMNVVVVLSALVLGLLVAGAKTNFDTDSKEIEQFAANITLLARELTHYGQEANDLHAQLRAFTLRKMELTWPADHHRQPVTGDVQTVQMLYDLEEHMRELNPQTEVQKAGRASALQIIGDLKRTSRLLAIQQSSRTPRPFLIVVIFWLSMLFLSFTIFAPRNSVVIATMLICAISVSVAVNLIVDMDYPFLGFIRVSSEPMQQALDRMKP